MHPAAELAQRLRLAARGAVQGNELIALLQEAADYIEDEPLMIYLAGFADGLNIPTTAIERTSPEE